MSLNIFKYIGLGILGLGGVSSVAALSSSKVRNFLRLSSSEIGEDRKGQFLYELSKKVFDFLNEKKKLESNKKEHLVKWLKSEFNSLLEVEENNGENFKSLCEEQITKENKFGSDMNKEYARLCFLDKSSEDDEYVLLQIKGGLLIWGEKLDYCEFYAGDKSNFELWYKFQTMYPNSNPSDVFNDGLNTNPEGIKDFFDETIQLDSNPALQIC